MQLYEHYDDNRSINTIRDDDNLEHNDRDGDSLGLDHGDDDNYDHVDYHFNNIVVGGGHYDEHTINLHLNPVCHGYVDLDNSVDCPVL